MKRLLLALVLMVGVFSTSPALARNEDERAPVDARLEGYAKDPAIKDGSTGLMWLLLVALSTVTIAVLFKSSNRTHLD